MGCCILKGDRLGQTANAKREGVAEKSIAYCRTRASRPQTSVDQHRRNVGASRRNMLFVLRRVVLSVHSHHPSPSSWLRLGLHLIKQVSQQFGVQTHITP